ERVVADVLPDLALAERVEVGVGEGPRPLGFQTEAHHGIDPASGGVADRIELVGAREAREERGQVWGDPLGREPKVAEGGTEETLEEAGEPQGSRGLAGRHDSPPATAIIPPGRAPAEPEFPWEDL